MISMYQRVIVIIIVFVCSIVPFSCYDDDCGESGFKYRIENYSFATGEVYRQKMGNVYFSASDSVHISNFAIQMKADSIIRLSEAQTPASFSLVSSALACSPAIILDNPVTELSVTATDTLWFYQEAYPPGADLSEFLGGVQYFSGYSFSEGNDHTELRFDMIPNKGFSTAFIFEVKFNEGGSYSTKTVRTDRVQVYY